MLEQPREPTAIYTQEGKKEKGAEPRGIISHPQSQETITVLIR